MKTQIMVPVNGSQDVERIVPFLQALIDQGGVGKVTLVRVVPPAPSVAVDYPLGYADIALADAERRAEAESFLQGIAEKIAWGSADHDIVALLGDESATLERFAAEKRFDSILLVSHRHSWLGRLFSNDLPDRIRDAVCTPIILLPCCEQRPIAA